MRQSLLREASAAISPAVRAAKEGTSTIPIVMVSAGALEAGLIDSLATSLALAVDNARWFTRLRTLGAEAERARIARDLHDSMAQSLRLVNRGVKQAGFYVLGGAAMPAILIEIGFLTNPKEEKKLASAEHREAIARAIYASLSEYKRRYDQRLSTAALPVKGTK